MNSADIYTLNVWFNCQASDTFELVQAELTQTEIQSLENIGAQIQIDDQYHIIITNSIDIGDNTQDNVNFNLASRFTNDWRCRPIINYKITKVIS